MRMKYVPPVLVKRDRLGKGLELLSVFEGAEMGGGEDVRRKGRHRVCRAWMMGTWM